jgi:hypothetical protein
LWRARHVWQSAFSKDLISRTLIVLCWFVSQKSERTPSPNWERSIRTLKNRNKCQKCKWPGYWRQIRTLTLRR